MNGENKQSLLTFGDPLPIGRLLTYRDLKKLGISVSRETLWRWEAAGTFPRRIYLSPQKVAWFADEVLAWLADRDAERVTRIYRSHD